MTYVVAVRFPSEKPENELAHLMQQVFDRNDVKGTFMFGPKQASLQEIMFQRDEEEDVTEVAARLTSLDHGFLTESVCELLLDELTLFDPPSELEPVMDALAGHDVELYGADRLRDALAELVDLVDLAA